MSDKGSITLLAIETSCDETGIAIASLKVKSQKSSNFAKATLDKKVKSVVSPSAMDSFEIEILAQSVASQIDIHKETGGVVPEVAAREHVSVLRPMMEKVLKEASIKSQDIDGIAVTIGPGLMPALAVGVQAARTLAFAWEKPIVPVHHIEGHIYSALLNTESGVRNQESPTPSNSLSGRGRARNVPNSLFIIPNSSSFPALALVVSGGHTMLIRMDRHLQYEVLGSTRDDAVGEAFDKVGRILGLPYPGGPHVSELAKKGDSSTIPFPVPMTGSGDLDFSFSGLKTAVLYKVQWLARHRKDARRSLGDDAISSGLLHSESNVVQEFAMTESVSSLPQRVKADIAASFQHAVVESLIVKVGAALSERAYRTLLLAGGVAANKLLRQRFLALADTHNIRARIAPVPLCSDNAIMIGMAGLFAYERGRITDWRDVDAVARINIEEFSLKEKGKRKKEK